MASGIECVGLVLAVLPLVIEAGKLYAQGTDSLLNIALQSRRDQRLQNFYDHFWWETVELHGRIREIVNALPRLSTQRKIELENVARLEDWTRDADVDTALRNYFAIEDDFNTFMHVMTRLVSLLAQLVRDSTINVVAADAVSHSSHSIVRAADGVLICGRIKLRCTTNSNNSLRTEIPSRRRAPFMKDSPFGRKKNTAPSA